MRTRLPVFLTLVATFAASPSLAQQANVDFSSSAGTPSAAFPGVVPAAGIWNQVPTNASAFPLLSPSGQATGMTLSVSGATDFSFDNPATSGDAGDLMDDGARSAGTITLTIDGLIPIGGGWDVYLFAWAPDAESEQSRVSLSPFFQADVGGTWGSVGQAFGRTWTIVPGVGQDPGPTVIQIAPAPGSSLATVNGLQIVFGCELCDQFCSAVDGALTSCPCSNAGAPDRGCDNAQGTGGVRLMHVAQDLGSSAATLLGSGFPPAASPTAIVIRANDLRPAPLTFGDGLLCVGIQGFTRLAATNAVGGTSTHAFGHGAGAGQFFYQLWYRNTPASYCVTSGSSAGAFNLSNGRILFW